MAPVTFSPGSSPPSPGLAPWAILISSCSAAARYAGVTPKRPEATCLMREAATSPTRRPRRPGYRSEVPPSPTRSSGTARAGSSPPSPELDLPPIRFMAMASTSWASGDRAPSDIPPVQKRCRMAVAGSTSSRGNGVRSLWGSRRSRSTVHGRLESSSQNSA